MIDTTDNQSYMNRLINSRGICKLNIRSDYNFINLLVDDYWHLIQFVQLGFFSLSIIYKRLKQKI